MKDSVLNRFNSIRRDDPEDDPTVESEQLDDLGAFGFLRGAHDRALMLELRFRDGSATGFPYTYLARVDFDPSTGIVLRFGGHTVTITGRNLSAKVPPNVQLHRMILRHRVPWIQQADGATAMAAPKGLLVIEGIKVE
jgi:hypothetical protein